MSSKELSDFIIRRIHELGLTRQEVARRAHITRSALYKLLDQEIEQARLSTFLNLAHALEVHPLCLIRMVVPKLKVASPEGTRYKNDYSGFVRDVTVPDNTVVSVSQEFDKLWEIQNLGAVTWENRRLVCVDDELVLFRKHDGELIPMSPRDLIPLEREIPIPVTYPAKTVKLSVRFRAPAYPCTAISYWKMVDEKGDFCFPQMEGIWCKVKVEAI
jgi:hypothetical protein